MKRRGQFLSLDALLSLVLVIMIIGVVINTNDMIKAEVSSMIGWYDRANIADNMLDVLTKSPGYPENWEKNVSSVRTVGLRSGNYSYALSYEKVLALNSSLNSANIRESLLNLSRWKDFQMEFYLLTKRVIVSGSFPRKISIDLSGDYDNIKIALSTDNNGNTAFEVECDSVKLNGNPAPTGNAINLNAGDLLEFIPIEAAAVLTGGNEREGTLPSGSYVEVQVIDARSNYHYSLDSTGGVCELHIGGQGQVKLTVSGNTPGNLNLTTQVIYPFNFTTPTYSFVVINGSLVTSNTTIRASKARSPWIEYEQRDFVISTLIYNQSFIISQNETKPLIAGKLKDNVPEYAYLEVEVPSNEAGGITLLAIDGATIKGILIEKNTSSSNVIGEIAWKEGNRTFAKFYEGNTSSVKILWKDIFSSFNTENGAKPIELWIYEKTFSGDVVLRDMNNVGMLLEPKFEPALIKLWVWDDR